MKQLTLLTALSTSLLLTACCIGESDSSGKKSQKDQASESKIMTSVKEKISNKEFASKVAGYWQSTCIPTGSRSKAYISHLSKIDDNRVLREEAYIGIYGTRDCTGKLYDADVIPQAVLNIDEFRKRGSKISKDNNQFTAVFDDGDVETYNRISRSEFYRLKATGE